ncbi:hypothetical protein HMPREF9943_00112 [Eggerthia catenaformis OT 569 = DSM 20559]|uniref:CTP synthase N-terminal domain-containing protein n=1 Tax=Eggerthia catenaformis OT 569 = DSM 20559 TaxID=999415 RepID=M2Q474_9FIRM|nr:hypothetical protein HMPREF9943_00112 [Eggerthia catenaformis OT 569 = DSM 20559]
MTKFIFITGDGAKTAQDLGYYERFIDKERREEYLGATVQVVPYITNEISRIFIRCKYCDY